MDNKEYYHLNKEEILKRVKQYYQNNKERILANQAKRRKEKNRKYYSKNRDKLLNRSKLYYVNNKDKQLESSRKYYSNNKQKKFQYIYNRQRTNPQELIKNKLRNALYRVLLIYSKGGNPRSSIKYGIDYKKIFEKLGKRPEGNYHIDHIKPLSSFDLNNPEEVKKAFAPENLRWLLALENLSKGKKYSNGGNAKGSG